MNHDGLGKLPLHGLTQSWVVLGVGRVGYADLSAWLRAGGRPTPHGPWRGDATVLEIRKLVCRDGAAELDNN